MTGANIIPRTTLVALSAAVAWAGVAPPAAATTSSTPTLAHPGPGAVVLYNAGPVSTKQDGTDSTVRLEAGAGPDVTSLELSFTQPDGRRVVIATLAVPDDDGAFSFEWDPAEDELASGDVVTLTATGTLAGGGTTSDSEAGVTLLSPTDPDVGTVNLNSTSGLGYFTPRSCNDVVHGPQAIVAGTTSRSSGRVDVGALDDLGNISGAAGGSARIVAGPDGRGTFNGIIALRDVFGDDHVVLRALSGATAGPSSKDTRDYEAYILYQQVPTTATVTSDGTTIGAASELTVTVLDQRGAPLSGASVRRASDAYPLGQTDEMGQAHTTLRGGTSESYVVDTDCNFRDSPDDVRTNSITAEQGRTVQIRLDPPSRPFSDVFTGEVLVTDADGTPAAGADVEITEAGPSDRYWRYRTSTRDDGTVYLDFSCPPGGTVDVRVRVNDPAGDPGNLDITSTSNTTCKTARPITVRLSSRSVGSTDRIVLEGPDAATGARATLYRVNGRGGLRRLTPPSSVNTYGNARFSVPDANPRRRTTYVVQVSATKWTQRATATTIQK